MSEWNNDLISYRMARANESIEDAHILAKEGRWYACVNRLYYACFYAISAILVYNGLSSSKHTGIRSLFNRHYVATGKVPKKLALIYNDLFERRQEGDYIDFVRFQESQVQPWISKTEELVGYITNPLKKEINRA